MPDQLLAAEFVWASTEEHQQRLLAEGWEDCGPHPIYTASHLMMRRIEEPTDPQEAPCQT
jgi:hypothetical protein